MGGHCVHHSYGVFKFRFLFVYWNLEENYLKEKKGEKWKRKTKIKLFEYLKDYWSHKKAEMGFSNHLKSQH